jgi:hypothetical protein
LYPKIKKAESQIEFYKLIGKKRKSSFDKEFFENYYKPKIEEQKKILSNLKNKIPITGCTDTQVIDEAIYKMIEGKIESFVIHLQESNKTIFKVSMEKDLDFLVAFFIEDNDYSWYKRYSILSELNFELSEDQKMLNRTFRLESKRNVLPLKEFISRIVVGLVGLREMDRNIFIKIIE